MQFTNLIASSNMDSNRENEYSFSVNYNDYIVLPKSVSLAKAVIPNVMMSFRPTELSIFVTETYISGDPQTFQINITNGYYDTVQEFLTMLNSVTSSSMSASYVWSYSQAYECLKLTNTDNQTFTLESYTYSPSSVVKRMGFDKNVGYISFDENDYNVVYATGVLRLTRTTGFFIATTLVNTNYTASPLNFNSVVDFVPIQLSNLSYGDSIVINQTNLSINQVKLPRNELYNASSTFSFQILDDEMKPFTDPDKGANSVLFFNLDYD